MKHAPVPSCILKAGGLPKKGYIQEIYELTPNSKGTLLMQRILVEQAGSGIPAQLVIRLGNLIGKSSGKNIFRSSNTWQKPGPDLSPCLSSLPRMFP